MTCEYKSISLSNIFKNLIYSNVTNGGKKIALWHVPKPHLLSKIVTEEADSGNEENRNLVSPGDQFCDVFAVTYESLYTASEFLAQELATSSHLQNLLNAEADPAVDESERQKTFVIALFMPPGINRILAQVRCCTVVSTLVI